MSSNVTVTAIAEVLTDAVPDVAVDAATIDAVVRELRVLHRGAALDFALTSRYMRLHRCRSGSPSSTPRVTRCHAEPVPVLSRELLQQVYPPAVLHPHRRRG